MGGAVVGQIHLHLVVVLLVLATVALHETLRQIEVHLGLLPLAVCGVNLCLVATWQTIHADDVLATDHIVVLCHLARIGDLEVTPLVLVAPGLRQLDSLQLFKGQLDEALFLCGEAADLQHGVGMVSRLLAART